MHSKPNYAGHDFTLLSGRIDYVKEVLGLRSLAALARAAGLEAQTLCAITRRKSECKPGTLEKLLSAIPPEKINHHWMRTGAGMPHGRGPEAAGFVEVPRMTVARTNLGKGRFEYTVSRSRQVRVFPAATLSGANPAVVVFDEMSDGSLAPYLMPEEAFVVNPADTELEEGHLYCVPDGHGVTVRRALRVDGRLRLCSVVDGGAANDDQLAAPSVLGRVVARGGTAI